MKNSRPGNSATACAPAPFRSSFFREHSAYPSTTAEAGRRRRRRGKFPEDARLDETFDPADLIHILHADSSQTLAIETVRKGRSLVIQGPPGTGKSQTIANLVAAAVYDGKSVLFVAEKMAALDVVFDRLVKAGLQDVCLELHSRQANKRAVIQEIERTLRVGAESCGFECRTGFFP